MNLDKCDTQLATEIREKCTAVMNGYKEYKDLINRDDVMEVIDKKQKKLMERVQYQVESRINSMGTASESTISANSRAARNPKAGAVAYAGPSA